MDIIVKEYKGAIRSVKVYKTENEMFYIETSTNGGDWERFINVHGNGVYDKKHTVMTAARKLKQ
ncbi:hypothetical protein FDI40_gp028 [Agrobacterium phage Atu_ph07]|uniref:Uncharacterized protein n=1 Tax=Agrobacterium phage Atu_ph07 TaxID=2024264 RepID=A0A2L0UZA5_9CAUD|nr:hypothetical protein FDI40_gp028 [Agrobacterium phage Atu_ph07]AUZ94840.1 hypothetical protein [Agrobacterium phage Atu_ph07]